MYLVVHRVAGKLCATAKKSPKFWMCIQMGGGPAMIYVAKALECYDELNAA